MSGDEGSAGAETADSSGPVQHGVPRNDRSSAAAHRLCRPGRQERAPVCSSRGGAVRVWRRAAASSRRRWRHRPPRRPRARSTPRSRPCATPRPRPASSSARPSTRAGSRTDAAYAGAAGRHFNYLTAEWEMKWDPIQKSPGVYDFSGGDRIVDFAESRGMRLKGHALVWHGATPKWVEALSPPEMRIAFEDHIRTVAGHYRRHVYAWDVVNEAIDDSQPGLRSTVFSRGLGPTTSRKPSAWRARPTPRRSSSTTTTGARASTASRTTSTTSSRT